MTPAFRTTSSSVNGSGTVDAHLAFSGPDGSTIDTYSPFTNLRRDLLIGLGALLVLVGVIAFSIFGEPYGVAAAATNSGATNSGATGTLTASGQGPAASVAADAATPAASPAIDPATAAAVLAYVVATAEQARLDAVNAYLASVAAKAADQAAAERAAARAAAPSGGNTGRAAPAAPDGSVWDRLAQCESGGNWSINTGNGFTGGLQFVRSTWLGVGGGEYAPDAYLATREQQIDIATRVLASQGWGAWPGCTSMMGLR
jgi:hypothetical protein